MTDQQASFSLKLEPSRNGFLFFLNLEVTHLIPSLKAAYLAASRLFPSFSFPGDCCPHQGTANPSAHWIAAACLQSPLQFNDFRKKPGWHATCNSLMRTKSDWSDKDLFCEGETPALSMTCLLLKCGKKVSLTVRDFVQRSKRCAGAALLFFVLAGLKPLMGQSPVPEFFITVTPSVVTVLQGEATAVRVTITCNTSSLVVAADCNTWPNFDFHLSGLPDDLHAETAPGRVGANTILISASSEAAVGSFPIQVNVVAGKTAQAQTLVLNIRRAVPTPSAPQESLKPAAVPARPVVAWEHHVLVAKSPDEFDRKANDLGRDSWELVNVITRKDLGVAEWIGFFKRPKRS